MNQQCDCGAETEGKWAGAHTKGCASLKTDWDDIPLPDQKKLDSALGAARFAMDNGGRLTEEELYELVEAARWARHHVPAGLNFMDLTTRNPLNQVYFRAGLIACREYMARFVEQGGDKTTAQSIRANWWPNLGPDPGPPRLFDFAELCEESTKPDGKPHWKMLEISPSVEALPRAYQFINSLVMTGDPAEPKQD